MSEIAFCSIALSVSNEWRYTWRLGRLKESLLQHHPDASMFFWQDALPAGARSFYESLYGFKPHCIKAALDAGFKKIAWIDCTAVVQDKLEYYDQFTAEHGGVLAVQDDNKLTGFCSDRALKYIGKNRDYLKDKHLIGGSFYYFDFNYPKAQTIFNEWLTAEKKGLFGSMAEQCSERLQGHRSDETMLSLMLYKHGSKPFTGATRYNWEKGGIILKQHFK